MSAAPLTLHRYVLVPSFLSPTRSPHPPPAVAPLSLPGPWFPAPNPSSQSCCGPTREPLEALGDPPVAAAPAPEAPSPMQTAGQSSRWEGFFFSCVSHFSWLLGTRSTSKVGSGFFLFRSLLDRWMDAFLAATLPAFVKNSIVRSCALLLSPPALPTFHPLLTSSHLLVLWTSPLSLPCSSFTITLTLHRRQVFTTFLSLFPHRLSFAKAEPYRCQRQSCMQGGAT